MAICNVSEVTVTEVNIVELLAANELDSSLRVGVTKNRAKS